MRITPLTVVLVLVLLIAGVTGLYWMNRLRPVPVEAVQVTRGDVVISVTVTGEIQGNQISDLSSKEHAWIREVTVEAGNPVRQGQALVKLQVSDVQADLIQAQGQLQQQQAALAYQRQGTRKEDLVRLRASVQQAEARLSVAQASLSSQKATTQEQQRRYDRMKNLHDKEFISDLELDESQSKAKSAQAQLALAQAEVDSARFQMEQARADLNRGVEGPTQPEVAEAAGAAIAAQGQVMAVKTRLEDRIITSPVDGFVTRRQKMVGDMATPGEVILSVVAADSLEVVALVEEPDLGMVASGKKAWVMLDVLPDVALSGTVRLVGGQVNPENGTVETRIVLDPDALKPYPDLKLLPGMTADITLVSAELTNAMVVPAPAIRKEGGQWVVYGFKDNALVKMPVKARRVSADRFEIVSGLEPSQWIAAILSMALDIEGPVTPRAKADEGETSGTGEE